MLFTSYISQLSQLHHDWIIDVVQERCAWKG